ncbi:MAG TPA: hypothetical protein VJJ48_02210 [Candidatus Paceibacterota bacterium]
MPDFHEVFRRVAQQHGLDERQEVVMLRCYSALCIFEEGHPEYVEAYEVLEADPVLFAAASELADAMCQ